MHTNKVTILNVFFFFVEVFVQQICSHTTTNGGVGLHYRPPPQMFELLDTVNKRKEEMLSILHGA